MNNVVAITKHLAEKNAREIHESSKATATTFEVHKTIDGRLYHETADGKFFRIISYLPDSFSYEFTQDPAVFAKTVTALGRFQKALY